VVSSPRFRVYPRMERVVLDLPAGVDLDTFVRQLEAHPDVWSVEPNFPVRAAEVPDDPLWPANDWNHRMVGLPEAWDIVDNASSVTVAVIDTGIRPEHPDLAPIVGGYDYVGNDSDPTDPGESDKVVASHGTHVAGIIGS